MGEMGNLQKLVLLGNLYALYKVAYFFIEVDFSKDFLIMLSAEH